MRSNPARAGEPPTLPQQNPAVKVYPRACGGTFTTTDATAYTQGLSPRVRGNPEWTTRRAGRSRSIPARAGEPPSTALRDFSHEVYPRVCGGTNSNPSNAAGSFGLSPRVRGNRSRCPDPAVEPGSIPACAGEPADSKRPQQMGAGLSPRVRGEPIVSQASPSRDTVYPRVCGGTALAATNTTSMHGLSPRVRGNHCRADVEVINQRSIPACAGEPRAGHRLSDLFQVYPRVCGGTSSTVDVSGFEGGLSPRVRGNPLESRSAFEQRRSIPACAGEPTGKPLRIRAEKVYPRVCGGTIASISLASKS